MTRAALAPLTMVIGAVTLVLTACGNYQARPQTVVSPCALSFPGMQMGRALANLYAGSLLCEFVVPPGARRLAGVPDAGHGFLEQSLPSAGVADEVSRIQFWQVPGSPQGVLAWEGLHLPHTLARTGSGSGGLRGTTVEWQDDYSLPPVPGQPSANGQIDSRIMSLFAVDAGSGRTDIEVAVSVDWIPPRRASELVPAGVRAVKISAVPDLNLHVTPPSPVTVTDPAQVRKIVALIDGLPLSPAGRYSCPFDAGAKVVLTFQPQAASGQPLAVAEDALEGCEWTSFTIGGGQQLSLGGPDSGRSFAGEILRIADLPWNLSKLEM